MPHMKVNSNSNRLVQNCVAEQQQQSQSSSDGPHSSLPNELYHPSGSLHDLRVGIIQSTTVSTEEAIRRAMILNVGTRRPPEARPQVLAQLQHPSPAQLSALRETREHSALYFTEHTEAPPLYESNDPNNTIQLLPAYSEEEHGEQTAPPAYSAEDLRRNAIALHMQHTRNTRRALGTMRQHRRARVGFRFSRHDPALLPLPQPREDAVVETRCWRQSRPRVASPGSRIPPALTTSPSLDSVSPTASLDTAFSESQAHNEQNSWRRRQQQQQQQDPGRSPTESMWSRAKQWWKRHSRLCDVDGATVTAMLAGCSGLVLMLLLAL